MLDTWLNGLLNLGTTFRGKLLVRSSLSPFVDTLGKDIPEHGLGDRVLTSHVTGTESCNGFLCGPLSGVILHLWTLTVSSQLTFRCLAQKKLASGYGQPSRVQFQATLFATIPLPSSMNGEFGTARVGSSIWQ
jgi:hypothetical protein